MPQELDQLRELLEAAGAEVSVLQAGSSRGLVLRRAPERIAVEGISGEGELWIVEGDIHELLAAGRPGATVAETGTLRLRGETFPVHRIAPPSLRPLGVKIPEGKGNLKRRAEWFQKRRGPVGS